MGAAKSSPSRSRVRVVRSDHSPEGGSAPSRVRRPGRNAAEVAEYVAQMTAELSAMAGAARLDLLTYFLNMARLEAEFHACRREPPGE